MPRTSLGQGDDGVAGFQPDRNPGSRASGLGTSPDPGGIWADQAAPDGPAPGACLECDSGAFAVRCRPARHGDPWNVDVEIYVHVRRARSEQSLDEHVRAEVATFLAANWPFGLPYPAIYIAPRTIEPDLNESLHAKCCVVDERVALIGSANFTDRGQSRNIEVGARIEDPGFARALVAQFRSAIGAGVFRRVGG